MSAVYSIEMLTTQQVVDRWGLLRPMLEASVIGNSISALDMDETYVLTRVMAGEAVVFLCCIDEKPTMVIVFQFSEANGHKCADIIALAGSKLAKFKALYWGAILDWLRASDVKFLDTMVPDERARMYSHLFGFDKSCTILRKELTHG